MTRTAHTYKDLERLKAWKVLDRAVRELGANGDLEELTARTHIVGYLLRSLEDAHLLAPDQVVTNGVHRRPKPQAVARS